MRKYRYASLIDGRIYTYISLKQMKKKDSKPVCVFDLGLSIQPITSHMYLSFEEQGLYLQKHVRIDETETRRVSFFLQTFLG